MKKIEIEIPEGKEVQWVGDTLKLVDIKKSITERIKTFEDACNELGEDNVLVQAYRTAEFNTSGNQNDVSDVIAYLKLRIIVAALNEGWKPQFTKDEYRYFPWFYFYTKEEYDKIGKKEKGRCVLCSGFSTSSNNGFVYVGANCDSSYSNSNSGSRLAFRTRELAKYAGKQFIDIYADYLV